MTDPSCGRVYLVGAGPGDPGLMTLRGVECLGRADLVLYDYLVNPQILEHANRAAELVCLGRHGQGRIVPQEEINQRLVDEARAGRTVVRLKGGDPAIFARGAEEAETLAAAGVAFEVVPGITTALAAGSYAGIPITHRDLASGVALVTGQESGEKQAMSLDFDALARFPGTLVIYMGVTTAPRWSAALVAAGKPADTPVAVVRRCSWADQTTIRCTLADIPDVLAQGKLRPPAIVIIGRVTELAETLSWFEARPLFGRPVLVTRPSDGARAMRDRLEELGARVLVEPAIEISDPPDWAPVDRAIAALDAYRWLVFSSANGVHYFLRRLIDTGHDMRALGGVRLAAIGPATATALASYHLKADLAPGEYRAEALAEALAPEVSGSRVLLARASRGREVLAESLTAAGAEVDQAVVYQSSDVTTPDEGVLEALQAGQIDWTTATSSAIARSLVNLYGDGLHKTHLVSISPLTTAVLRDLGHAPAAEAAQYTSDGVVDAILRDAK